jgi:Ca2+-transporting ATPase
MKVVETKGWEGHEPINGFDVLELCLALNNDVKKSGKEELIGDPTEIALVGFFINKHKAAAFEELRNTLPRVAEAPFDSERKSMTTVHKLDGRFLIVTKGAVESVTANLRSEEENSRILDLANDWSGNGIRVIAFAFRVTDSVPGDPQSKDLEKELEFAGLAGMVDPPREEAKKAIEECKTAGIHAVLITGDHPATASAIARQLGILSESDIAVTGKELQSMSDAEIEEKVEKIRVYARVSPEQKLRIVKTLQKKGHFVAMTGDGVNDAPSLKASNIGVAMGINGTDVSKEASDMVLLDDNFATIVKAVKEGRHIYDNIRKFVKYIMTCNSAEILTMFLAPLLGLPIPLLPIHILWINLVTDGLPGLALASERSEEDIMKRAPRKTDESLFAGGVGYHIAWVGLLMAVVTLGTQAWFVQSKNTHWQTMVFTVLSFSQLAHVMGIRSDKRFLFKLGIFSNRPLLGAVVLTFVLQLGVIYLPFANEVFRTEPLTLNELAICVALSLIVLTGVELEKLVKGKVQAPRS